MKWFSRFAMAGMFASLLALSHVAEAGWHHRHYGAPAYYAPVQMVAPAAFVAPSAFVVPSSSFDSSAFSFQVVPAASSNASAQANIGNLLDTLLRFKQIMDTNRPGDCGNSGGGAVSGDAARLQRIEAKLDELRTRLIGSTPPVGGGRGGFGDVDETDVFGASAVGAGRGAQQMSSVERLQHHAQRLEAVQRDFVRAYDDVSVETTANTAYAAEMKMKLDSMKAMVDAMRKK